ncbi:MBOAT family protein [Gemmatimonas sp.]|uniref:MBOAT family O-acyltransferase n=1 Tax=Gemmatimonas sp. TaxID=1962908 RepID=UPI0035676075
MVFSDPIFLYTFLPAVLLIFWAGAWKARNVFLCIAGSVFYMWGGGEFVILLLASIGLNHGAAVYIDRERSTNPRRCRWVVRAVVVLDLLALAVWKYGGFVVEQTTALLRQVGIEAGATLSLALPIAISFFTFQSISYVLDVSRGTTQPADRLVDYAAYMLLFPQLIAGPIVRYEEVHRDLVMLPRRRLDDFAMGAPRFFWGLAKKVLIADQMAAIANHVYALPDNRITTATAWIGVFAYALQIYFDFSGYSDMAIGLACMFGFGFPENFDRPYSAHSVTDFWRRWHITLSSWFRDYVYVPLGGNRDGPWRTYRNLAIVFALTGIWHGANWTFIVWGAFHGACLIIERLTGTGTLDARRLALPRRLLTFMLVCIGWAMFRAGDVAQGWSMIFAMITPQGMGLPVTLEELLSNQRLAYFALGACVLILPRAPSFGSRLSVPGGTARARVRTLVIATVAPVACLYTLSSTFSPFLYFQF